MFRPNLQDLSKNKYVHSNFSLFFTTSVPDILFPSLYQAVFGVGLPVTEQVRVKLPDERAATIAGGISLIRKNLSPP